MLGRYVRLHIIVEGQTEETFVKNLFKGHLGRLGIDVSVSLIRPRNGGNYSFHVLKERIEKQLKSDSGVFVSMMIDYYKIPIDYPGYKEKNKIQSPIERVKFLEKELKESISDSRFIPYLQLHEFEALLFTRPDLIHSSIPSSSEKSLRALTDIQNRFSNPEDINSKEPPGKRLKVIYPRYQKPSNGLSISQKIGLDEIRKACPHFNEWFNVLEALKDNI